MMTAAVLAVLLSFTTLPAQERRPVCDLFADAEIATVAGTPIKQKVAALGADVCAWTGQRLLTIARMPEQRPDAIAGLLGVVERRAGEGAAVKEVTGLGDRAIAEIPAGGRRLELWVASGRTVWRFTVDQAGAGARPEDLLPALEKLATTALQ